MIHGVLPSVREIEPIIEVRWVPALGVLEDGLELVESLRCPRLRSFSGLVLVPQRRDFVAQRLRQRREEPEQVPSLVSRLVLAAPCLLRRGDVATDRFAEVVDDADLD